MSILFSPAELFNLAILIEKNGMDFYAKAESLAADDKSRLLFRYLKEQEIKHVDDFTNLYNMSKQSVPQEPLPEAPEGFEEYASAFVDFEFVNEFARDKDRILASGSLNAIADFSLQFEEETLEFYEHLRELVSGPALDLLTNIISEEEQHIQRLKDIQPLFQK